MGTVDSLSQLEVDLTIIEMGKKSIHLESTENEFFLKQEQLIEKIERSTECIKAIAASYGIRTITIVVAYLSPQSMNANGLDRIDVFLAAEKEHRELASIELYYVTCDIERELRIQISSMPLAGKHHYLAPTMVERDRCPTLRK